MLKFTTACMFAGKTAQLINTYEIYKHKGLNPIVIKPVIDDREGSFKGWGTTSSRLMPDHPIPAYYFTDLKKELPELDCGMILVDEAQFLTRADVRELAKVVDAKNIEIHAYGLKTDVNGDLFEGSAALLALADNVYEMESLCQIKDCTNKAQMHLRYVNGIVDRSGQSVAVEKGDITYKAVCRHHWRNE